MHFQICVTAALFVCVLAAEKNSPCVTPNGENATCISIHSCTVIKQALVYLEPDVVEFARKSQCGYEGNTPIVCCGSAGRITTPAPIHESTTRIPYKPPLATVINNEFLPDSSLCGLQAKSERIVGGSITDLDEFPWVVAMKYTASDGSPDSFRCSGSLINQRYVLTAAQCLYIRGFNLTGVRLGEWRFSTTEDCMQFDSVNDTICADPVVDLAIVEKIPHPYYSKNSGDNDIALVRLEKQVQYTDFVRPICLPPKNYPEPTAGTKLYVSGWGVTENGSQSDVKLKVRIPMVRNEICQGVYPDSTHINPNQACAGGEAGKDACSGDSGGPLMNTYVKEDKTEETQWYQEGIIYRGLGCGDRGVPGLYTRISRYTSWILNNLRHT